MTDSQILNELSSLPNELKKEVLDFVKFLKSKSRKALPIKRRKFGAAKGFFVMHEDFDKPLDDFKEYI